MYGNTSDKLTSRQAQRLTELDSPKSPPTDPCPLQPGPLNCCIWLRFRKTDPVKHREIRTTVRISRCFTRPFFSDISQMRVFRLGRPEGDMKTKRLARSIPPKSRNGTVENRPLDRTCGQEGPKRLRQRQTQPQMPPKRPSQASKIKRLV